MAEFTKGDVIVLTEKAEELERISAGKFIPRKGDEVYTRRRYSTEIEYVVFEEWVRAAHIKKPGDPGSYEPPPGKWKRKKLDTDMTMGCSLVGCPGKVIDTRQCEISEDSSEPQPTSAPQAKHMVNECLVEIAVRLVR
ncbi:MAG: hypothetical protein KAV82_00360 [Phycisphaerae bacterium]|nr:hypothetical protein [Phycisphaerae bacterium]